MTQTGLTERQEELLVALDDTAEHVSWEFEPEAYQGVSTIGFAHIAGIDGRSSFMQLLRTLAESGNEHVVEHRDGYMIEIGRLALSVLPAHNGGYRMSITDVGAYRDGPEHQRLDVRERLHNLVLNRLQYNGFLTGCRVKSRMD